MTMRRAVLVLALCSLVAPLAAVADDPPVVTVPPDMIVEAQGFSGAAVTYTASAVDDRGRPIPVTCAPPSGSVFPFGTTTVTCSARDSGDTTTRRFEITVVDTTPPVLTVPGPLRVQTSSRSGKVVTYTASAADLVDGSVPVSCAPGPGSRFPVGTTKVACSAADRRSNGAVATFDVTVVFVVKRSARNAAMLAPSPGATVRAAPLLRWRAARKARFYNVQLFRRGHKVLSAWPTRARFRLHARWTFKGRAYRLKPGSYTWLVWPAYGSVAHPRYGKLLGVSSFVFAKKR